MGIYSGIVQLLAGFYKPPSIFVRKQALDLSIYTKELIYYSILTHVMNTALDVYDAIALTLHANDGRLSNRTTLQKLIYFETLKLKSLKSIPYHNHFYGPYSHQVASALDETVAFSYLSERVSSRYNHESYHYELTNSGKKYANDIQTTFHDQFKTINEVVKTCKKHCSLQATALSYSAKAHYILVNGGKVQYTIDDVRKAAQKFEWKISADDAEEGMQLLEKLGLAHSV